MPENQLTLSPLPGLLRLSLEVSDTGHLVAIHVRGEISGDYVRVELTQPEALGLVVSLLAAAAGVEKVTGEEPALLDALRKAIKTGQ